MINYPKNAYLRTDRKHPQILLVLKNNTQKTFTLHSLNSNNKKDVEVAKEILDTLRRKIALRTFNIEEYIQSPKTSITMEEFYNIYIKYREKQFIANEISKKTHESDYYSLKLFIKNIGNKKQIIDIDDKVINEFKYNLLSGKNFNNKKYSPNSVSTYMKNISVAFSYAKLLKIIDRNPFTLVNKPKFEKNIRPLHLNEILKLREYFLDKPLWQLHSFNLSLWTGCRRESIVTIKDSDLVFEKINNKYKPFLHLIEKGRKERMVPLSNKPLNLINLRIKILNNIDIQNKIIDRLSSPLYCKCAKNRLKDKYLFWEIKRLSSISQAFQRARDELGFSGITFHSLRKTFATISLDQGISLESIQNMLGHSDLKTTQESYAKTTIIKTSLEMDKFDPP